MHSHYIEKKALKKHISEVFKRIFPLYCFLCLNPSDSDLSICKSCFLDLPTNNRCCRQCAIPLMTVNDNHICGQCSKSKLATDRTWAPYRYEIPVDYLITQFKYHAQEHLAKTLARLMLNAPVNLSVDAFIAVPMHSTREKQRGGNHSLFLTQELTKATCIPNLSHRVKRIRNTPPQTGLNAKQRRKNLRTAFSISGNFKGQHLVIIDDVITTGTTTQTLAQQLKKHGAKSVDVWCLARSVSP